MFRSSVKFGVPVARNAVNASSGKPPLSLTVLSVIVLVMAVLTVLNSVIGDRTPPGPISFRCVNCDYAVVYTVEEVRKLVPPSAGPPMGPLVVPCPKCGKTTLTQAVKCPKCGEGFVIKNNIAAGIFDDKCPKCHESYAKTWKEQYLKEHGE